MKRIVLLVMVGCGGGSSGGAGDPISMTDAKAVCDAFTAHATTCGWGGNVNSYDWNCGEASLVWREDAYREFADCATNLPCTGDGASCYTQTKTSIEPLDYHVTYASKCQARITECDLGAATCSADTWELYTKDIVTQITACMDQPCAQIQSCISTVL